MGAIEISKYCADIVRPIELDFANKGGFVNICNRDRRFIKPAQPRHDLRSKTLRANKTRSLRSLANQVIGDVRLRGDDGLAIELFENRVDDPVEQVEYARVAEGVVAVQVVAIENRIADAG